jgi:hypothetical protein
MGLFKRKKEQEVEEQIPELPELPKPNEFSLPELPKPLENEKSGNLPELPQLPELKAEEMPPTQVIKQEITKPQEPKMQKSHFEGKIKTAAMPAQIQTPPELPAPISEMHEPTIIPPQKPIRTRQIAEISPRQRPPVKDIEPIYVRLDKFQASLDSFEEIKNKIIDIEEILRKTKETKQKEEKELEEWEREMQILKSRIDAIDRTIFNKLD